MPCEILICAKDFTTVKKGGVAKIKDQPASWGTKQGLPNFIKLIIPDAIKAQIIHFVKAWDLKFKHTIVSENDLGYRIKIEVDPQYVSVSNAGKDKISLEIKTYLEVYGGVIVSHTPTEVVFNIAKPVDLVELKKNFADIFNSVFNFRRYRFDTSDVDDVIAAGGEVTRTKVQVLALVKDKLDE